jgi:trehalose/maltose hydrolase-like predicted phosphorylase
MSMSPRSAAGALIAGSLLAIAGLGSVPTGSAAARGMPGNSGAFALTATNPRASNYAPTFTGNGLLGVRVPPEGQGYDAGADYAGGAVPADSELAGFYGRNVHAPKASERVQQRANLPTWSTLELSVGGHTFHPTPRNTSGYRQTLDLRTGMITTRGIWTAPDGRSTALTYRVLADRAREHVGLVRLTFTPRWSGTANVTDLIDGTPDTDVATGVPVLTMGVAKDWNAAQRQAELTVKTLGLGIQATLVSQLVPSANITAPSVPVDRRAAQSAGQRVDFPVLAGHTYTLTKYVGIQDTAASDATTTTAQQQASSAAHTGWRTLLAGNRAAWASLWAGRIDISGDRTVATDVNASEFYLWSSTRTDQQWSISPAGLSSNGYDGHIFWDADTWMFPSLLAQHPDLAEAMEAYRSNRLSEAYQHARATGSRGARFPWESALTGTEQIPPPPSVNSEGLYEQHITADIALAQWQYYLATGDKAWLRYRGWPVLQGAAAFWASRATSDGHGGLEIKHVTGPDEENPDVSDEVYTEVGARTTLLDAVAAAHRLHKQAPAAWTRIAAKLDVPVADGIHPEFNGYQGQLVKQSDVTMLQYPWAFPMSTAVARADLDFYQPREDPGGPSMDDAIASIDSSALRTPGCQSYVYTLRSYEPFIRDVFHQFSETRTGGAFTFMTGIGGFLQEFLYGYSGMRWEQGDLHLAPSLSGSLGTITLRDVAWRGRRFTIRIGPRHTIVILLSGSPMTVSTPQGRGLVTQGTRLEIATAQPAQTPTDDAVRCDNAQASSSATGAPALAAVDGSTATDWEPTATPAALTVPTRAGHRTISQVTVRWGQYFQPVSKINTSPKAGPVLTLRSLRYLVEVRTGGHWRRVALVHGASPQLTDTVDFRSVRGSAVRLRLLAGSGQHSTRTDLAGTVTASVPLEPMVQELTAR